MDTSELKYLKEQWFDLMAVFNSPKTETLWTEITQRYSEKHRTYHNLHHLYDLFTKLENHQEDLTDLKAIKLAIWYHDIVYNPMSKRNEEESARLCSRRLDELGCPDDLIKKVFKLISSTQTHDVEGWESEANKKDNEYLLDLDLSILGSDKKTYQQYTQQIRKEYKIVPVFLYQPGRKKVLKHFLEKDRIFKTKPFFKSCEAMARINLRKELEG